MTTLEQFLACPACGAGMTVAAAAVHCRGCGESWPVEGGLPLFRGRGERYFYDFEYSEEDMRALLERAESMGWLEALRTTQNKQGQLPSQYFIDYNSREDRLCSAPLLNPAPDKIALDYGCGMGAVSRALARSFGTVLSFDATYERAKFWDIRRRQEHVDNAHVFSWNGLGRPPIKKCSVDAVVLNGVLEWTPESIRHGSPWAVQLQVLRNIIDLLRPKGRLYLAIENRWAGRYLIGHRDHHSGLRFVTLLPRPLADWYSRARKGRPYRVHTHSLGAYRRLLREAGFARVDFYEPYPRYMFPETMIPLDDEAQLAAVRRADSDFESWLVRTMSRIGLGKHFPFTYAMIAEKGDASQAETTEAAA